MGWVYKGIENYTCRCLIFYVWNIYQRKLTTYSVNECCKIASLYILYDCAERRLHSVLLSFYILLSFLQHVQVLLTTRLFGGILFTFKLQLSPVNWSLSNMLNLLVSNVCLTEQHLHLNVKSIFKYRHGFDVTLSLGCFIYYLNQSSFLLIIFS